MTGKTPPAGNTKDVEIIVPLKYLSTFWRTLEMPLINCDVNLILTWSKDCVISSATGETTFKITETKMYVPVVTLSTQDNAKLLQQLKSGFKRTINWNKYESNIKIFAQNRYLNHLINATLINSSKMVGDNETGFPHEFLLANREVSNLCKAFANHSSADIKLSKTQLSKVMQLGGFLSRLLGPLLKAGLPLIKNVIKPLAKSVLIPLGLTAAVSEADAGVHKKILESGNMTTLII